jgi:stage II sporulation protein D
MRRKICFILISILLTLSFLNEAWSLSVRPRGPKKYIRVAIVKDREEIRLQLKGGYRILTLYTDELLKEGVNLEAKILPTHSGIRLNDDDIRFFGVRIETKRDASIIIDGRRFRGLVDIVRGEDLSLLAVNHVDIEEYLCGALHHEVPYFWPYETLRAQAIASRTFALYQNRVNKDEDYDLTSTHFSQVYGGATGERRRTNRAVIQTYGEILTYNGEIFPAYFHSTCGGHTQDASRFWKIDIPPLKGIECNHCRLSPHYKWDRRVSLSEIQERLNKGGLEIGRIKSIEVSGYDESGRTINLKIYHAKGETVISSYRFRILIGPTLIRSTNFILDVDSEEAYFDGKGWGHGVGMCQWGALFLSLKRHKTEEILKFYYPQSEIKNIWDEDGNLKQF